MDGFTYNLLPIMKVSNNRDFLPRYPETL